MDFIGRFECINEDFAQVHERPGNHANLQHLNKTEGSKKDYREYYTDETRKIVEAVYQEDIRIFGYDFDNKFLNT